MPQGKRKRPVRHDRSPHLSRKTGKAVSGSVVNPENAERQTRKENFSSETLKKSTGSLAKLSVASEHVPKILQQTMADSISEVEKVAQEKLGIPVTVMWDERTARRKADRNRDGVVEIFNLFGKAALRVDEETVALTISYQQMEFMPNGEQPSTFTHNMVLSLNGRIIRNMEDLLDEMEDQKRKKNLFSRMRRGR